MESQPQNPENFHPCDKECRNTMLSASVSFAEEKQEG